MPDTLKIIYADVLRALPKTAWLINVGRGATVDETALREALISGEIAGAAIDVTATEPLPYGDPLWSAPNLIITPHTAGGRPSAPTPDRDQRPRPPRRRRDHQRRRPLTRLRFSR